MSANTVQFVKIPAPEMESEFKRILLKHGFSEEKANTCAHLYTINSLEGVYTHGVNRFAKFIQYVIDGHIKPNQEPMCVHRAGVLQPAGAVHEDAGVYGAADRGLRRAGRPESGGRIVLASR